jgi:hypothetical protein
VHGQRRKSWVCILVCWSGARSRSDERDCIIGHPGKLASRPSRRQTAAESPRARPLLLHIAIPAAAALLHAPSARTAQNVCVRPSHTATPRIPLKVRPHRPARTL